VGVDGDVEEEEVVARSCSSSREKVRLFCLMDPAIVSLAAYPRHSISCMWFCYAVVWDIAYLYLTSMMQACSSFPLSHLTPSILPSGQMGHHIHVPCSYIELDTHDALWRPVFDVTEHRFDVYALFGRSGTGAVGLADQEAIDEER
jgi:hypothetical protein